MGGNSAAELHLGQGWLNGKACSGFCDPCLFGARDSKCLVQGSVSRAMLRLLPCCCVTGCFGFQHGCWLFRDHGCLPFALAAFPGASVDCFLDGTLSWIFAGCVDAGFVPPRLGALCPSLSSGASFICKLCDRARNNHIGRSGVMACHQLSSMPACSWVFLPPCCAKGFRSVGLDSAAVAACQRTGFH